MKYAAINFLLSFLIAQALIIIPTAYSSDLPDFPFVVAIGNAEKDVKPNMATIQLRITAFEKESDLALKTVNLTTTAVSTSIQKYGISVKNIEATDIEKSTQRKRDNEYNENEIIGYDVSRSITIRLDNISKYTELMSDLVALNNVSNVTTSFDVSNRAEIESELIGIASKDANQKAKKMAESLGTNIQSVYAISQASNFEGLFATFGASSGNVSAKMEFRDTSYNTIMFVPKSINLQQSINVVYKIQ